MLVGALWGAGSAAAAAPTLAQCSWDRPGHNPYTGEIPAAVDRYTDIPADVRQRLKQRMQQRRYDDLVDIRRDSIAGRQGYEPAIRDMHFGERSVCRGVARGGWSAQMHERGLVYCDSGHCILVPTVCRNVSRITPQVSATQAELGELLFDPPGAGLPAGPSFDDLGGTPASVAGLPGAWSDAPVGFATDGRRSRDPGWTGGGGGGGSRPPKPPGELLPPPPTPGGHVVVPEPAGALLIGAGLALLLGWRRFQRRRGDAN